ncbi:GNAT family N-acetyltransferase [Streptomyces sp. TP-A0874]|uniref:GNAT family N-acetyltransferase n=1 Tax=Streptomyces sp. TP-A0874 TaxID=549819 RepID=UPI0008534633|nr:GNAT family N-acetyltransferase [Streptomyces sp. TP-A0874]
MDHGGVRALFDRQMRRLAKADPGTRVELTGGVVRQMGAEHDWNGILWSDLDAASAAAAIAEQVRHFTQLGLEFEWKVYAHDQPGDLGRRLRAAGFAPEPEEALMVAPVRDLSTEVALPEGVHLCPVTDSAGVELLATVTEEVFGIDGVRARQRLLTQLDRGPKRVSMTIAMAGDLPVCGARLELIPGTEFAGLWGGGTVSAWRGRGIYRALVAHRARIAAGLGYRYLQVDASEQSRPILRRLGFVQLSTTTPYRYRPGALSSQA